MNPMHKAPSSPAWLRMLSALTLLALAGVVVAPRAGAQPNAHPPERMTYQGYLVDANGNALATNAPHNYDVIFRIWNSESGTAPANRLWTEQQTVTVDKGYFSVMLGEGSSIGEARPALSTVFTNDNASERWVGLTVKGIGAGGTDVDILPRLRLLTSPYAFLANRVSGGGVITTDNLAPAIASGLWTGSGANVYRADGNVGIGSSTPARRLHVQDPGAQTGRIQVGGTGANGEPKLIHFGDGSFVTLGENGADDRMELTASQFFFKPGNVGIGTAAPGSSLEVAGGIRARGGAPGAFGASNNGYAFSGNGGDTDSGMFSTADGRLQFYTDNVERMRISGGNVGIGADTLADILHVRTFSPRIRAESSSDSFAGFISKNSNAEWFAGVQSGVASYWTVYQNSPSFGERLVVASGGNVGIATVDPQTRLHVVGPNAGQLRVQNSINNHWWNIYSENNPNTGNLLFVSSANTGAFISRNNGSVGNISDRNAKKDIQPMTEVLDKVLKLHPVTFRYLNTAEDAPLTHGFIAQDVEPLFPDLVTTVGDKLALSVSEFSSLAIAALQEMHRAVEARLADKDREVAELQAKLSRITAQEEANANRLAALEKLLHERLTSANPERAAR